MHAVEDLARRIHVGARSWKVVATSRLDRLGELDERGEGVISMAIAVLIVAFLGAAAWLAFKGLLDGTKDKAETQLSKVGG